MTMATTISKLNNIENFSVSADFIFNRYSVNLLDSSQITAKRIFEILAVSFFLLLIASWLFPIIALFIKMESKGPVFYNQERIGLNRRASDRRKPGIKMQDERRSEISRRKYTGYGKPFIMYKLRTMKENAEKTGPVLAKENDSRVTRIGRVLRRTRIDEIPQFINVIKGDMSLIGPRPERSFYIKSIKEELPEFTLRLKTKPGITGLAQVESGYANSAPLMKKKLIYDLSYILSLSLLKEAMIIIKTFSVIITGKGAY
jgi:putative colanic acid biosynthesis UDP-glucose lipid carrier transferase